MMLNRKRICQQWLWRTSVWSQCKTEVKKTTERTTKLYFYLSVHSFLLMWLTVWKTDRCTTNVTHAHIYMFFKANSQYINWAETKTSIYSLIICSHSHLWGFCLAWLFVFSCLLSSSHFIQTRWFAITAITDVVLYSNTNHCQKVMQTFSGSSLNFSFFNPQKKAPETLKYHQTCFFTASTPEQYLEEKSASESRFTGHRRAGVALCVMKSPSVQTEQNPCTNGRYSDASDHFEKSCRPLNTTLICGQ